MILASKWVDTILTLSRTAGEGRVRVVKVS